MPPPAVDGEMPLPPARLTDLCDTEPTPFRDERQRLTPSTSGVDPAASGRDQVRQMGRSGSRGSPPELHGNMTMQAKMKRKVRELAMWHKRSRRSGGGGMPSRGLRQACGDLMLEGVLRFFGVCAWLSDNFVGLGMLVSTALAYKFPHFGRQEGPLRPEYSVTALTAVLFFLFGVTFRRERLREAVLHIRLNTFVLFYTFIIVPAVLYLALLLPGVRSAFSVELRLGILVTACMPPSSTTTISLTHVAGGNEGVAVASTTIGHLIGVFVSPALISVLLASEQFTEQVQLARPAVLRLLSCVVVLPLVAGQVCQAFLPRGKARAPAGLLPLLSREEDDCGARFAATRLVGHLSQFVLLVLNYYVFCSCFAHLGTLEWKELSRSIVPLCAFVAVQLLLQLVLCWGLLSLTAVEPTARVAVLLACASKTESLAIPLVITMFDRSTPIGLLPVPIVLQNCLQAVLLGLLVGPLRSWLRSERTKLASSMPPAFIASGSTLFTPGDDMLQHGGETDWGHMPDPLESSALDTHRADTPSGKHIV
eukprot:Hpha_TRINITY_DN33729_c0_g1::TRINITY_DN33729_c0_g1_i1::g.25036::m.25036/K14347/SLC10A7, P7; solute carrier family 10 (sodium/bile acid cotransporter), member 7